MPMRSFVLVFCALLPGAALAAGQMAFPGAQWETASPRSQGVDPEKLAAAIRYLEAHTPRDRADQLVIVRNGQLIHAGPRAEEVHGVWSCTKSFTSTVLGLLIDDGKCTLDTLARDVLPEMGAQYPAVTLRHFTTMTSGYRAIGDEPHGSYFHGPSSTPFLPGPPLFSPPGSRYAYWDSAMNQFAHILTRIAGEPIVDLFRRRIADPVGMRPDKWKWGAFETGGIPVNGGSGNSNRHVFICALEMARLGHLFLNKGNWNGRQLLSARWVEQATRVQVPATVPVAQPDPGFGGPGRYGFNWWANGVDAQGKRAWPGVPENAFAASGHNNNKLFVIPSWSMVVVRLGLDQGREGGFAVPGETWAEFLRQLGEASGAPLAADGPAGGKSKYE